MSKLMTLDLLFQRLKDGRVKLTDTFPVSQRAWSTQGSKMFVELGSRIAVEDLIRGIIIESGGPLLHPGHERGNARHDRGVAHGCVTSGSAFC